ncbi:agmatinase [Candidatus Micrarchaeota archaeon CG1_02_51_15]|nr:MAG: agmatinase [Candidatus Micrarchaeota archaeon CG1_02_51_15]
MAFLGSECENPSKAKAAVLPIPYEETASYAKGTAEGPAAIIAASRELEYYDDETGTTPWDAGINTLPELKPPKNPAKMAQTVQAAVDKILSAQQFPVMLGGEHSITIGAVRVAKKRFPNLSVLQFDAHADLRDEYDGSNYSHACTLRRVIEDGITVAQVGIRSTDRESLEWAQGKTKIFWARNKSNWSAADVLAALTHDVYVTFDVDAFDPSIMPATGTPEPGGLLWDETLAILKPVFSQKNVVGCDVTELLPLKEMHAPTFTAAKLVHKMIAYKFERALRNSK